MSNTMDKVKEAPANPPDPAEETRAQLIERLAPGYVEVATWHKADRCHPGENELHMCLAWWTHLQKWLPGCAGTTSTRPRIWLRKKPGANKEGE